MSRQACVALLISAVVAAAGISCGPSAGPTNGGGGGLITLQGAGASFPAPLYDRWFQEFGDQHRDIRVNYQSVGSGAGVNQFTQKLVDFGASDAAMTDEEIAAVDAGVVLLPMTAGSIVLGYNLEGIDQLKLSREAYTGIFLGKITNWNDPAIAASNEGLTLPDQKITALVRSDSSGTTYVFTKHLSEISEEWKNGPGTNKKPNWPGATIGAKGNQGITQQLKDIPGSIGYIEFGFADKAGVPMAALENREGTFVTPTIESAQASLAGAEFPDSLILWLPDPEGAESYPIVTYTWLLCYKKYEDPAKAEALKKVIEYCLTEGQKVSEEMGYIPLPESVTEIVLKASQTIQ